MNAIQSAPPGPAAGVMARVGHYRWTICALLFFATTINYVDRQVLGILAPTLQREIGFNEQQYANIVSFFTLAYALGFLVAGRIMDRVGTRRGYAGAIGLWSISAMSHALVSSVAGFSVARFFLGLGESGNFPAAIKTVTEWFPQRERAFALGIFNAGTNVGAIITPLVMPWIVLTWGWRAAFLTTGAFSMIWLVTWLAVYRPPAEHPKLKPAELAYILSDPVVPMATMSWLRVLRFRQTWAYAIGKGLTDPVWWFYLFWLPKFLDARFGLKLTQMAAPLIVMYVMADVGSIGGGWLSGALMGRGMTVNAGRKVAMLCAALIIVPTMMAPRVSGMWMAVGIVGVALAAHQWWSANLMTIPGDVFPQNAIGSVIGIGGFAGAASGFFFQRLTGWVLQNNGNNYTPIFLYCGLAYVTALAIVHLLSPRLTPATLDAEGRPV